MNQARVDGRRRSSRKWGEERSMSGRTRVSIGLPVFNGERFVAEAIDSILAQTFEDFELIISDNASTDGTEEICRCYAEKDERIRFVRNRENYGAAFNFNQTFHLSSGGYFKWVEGLVEVECGPVVLPIPYEPDPLVLLRVTPADFLGPVRGRVVRDDQLEVLERLREDRIDRLSDESLPIEHGKADAHPRATVHRSVFAPATDGPSTTATSASVPISPSITRISFS